ncbi:MAG: DNA-binding protein WhiA [Clostridia bacterium]|nr:DNA-binding protein WhiA [Clostridia bacterium]
MKMSFSSDIKQELNKNSNLANKEMVKYELMGYLIAGNTNLIKGKEIKFSTESDYNINRFSKLLSNLDINHKIEVSGKTFVIKVKIRDINFMKIVNDQLVLNLEKTTKEEILKAMVRGAFMGAGSVNNPEKEYHLEIDLGNSKSLEEVQKILQQLGIRVKTLQTAIYIKEGEEISKFLALIGANKAVMKFEDIRIQKEMRGKVNRLVNCETANLNKTINASIRQITSIKKLQETGAFQKLEDHLKEIAMLRLENPDMPLQELGKLLKKPVGKSGVNYRLNKIVELAEEKKE